MLSKMDIWSYVGMSKMDKVCVHYGHWWYLHHLSIMDKNT